jgi:hypothetical protein
MSSCKVIMPPLAVIIAVPLNVRPVPQVKVYAPVTGSNTSVLPLPPMSTSVIPPPATVTLNVQLRGEFVHPVSVAVQVTTVAPGGNADPEGGTQVAVTGDEDPTVDGATKLTVVGPVPVVQMSGGQVSVHGGVGAVLQAKVIPSY